MNRKTLITILCVVYCAVLIGALIEGYCHRQDEPMSATFKADTIDYAQVPFSEEVYRSVLDEAVMFPEVVYAQSVIETGWFTSRLFREHNNLFGLYNSYKGHFFQYHSWYGSIVGEDRDGKHYPGYIDIQKRYKGGDDVEEYLQWLERIGYAEDTTYVRKIRKLIK